VVVARREGFAALLVVVREELVVLRAVARQFLVDVLGNGESPSLMLVEVLDHLLG
jgi:hypothetical protein